MRNRSIRFIMILPAMLLIMCLAPGAAAGQTIHVPDDYTTIQAALDAAADTYTIIVRDGVYTGAGNKNLDFGGKALTLRSENGPENCIINCERDGRGFYFHSGETSASVVDGLTIFHGFATEEMDGGLGGGILCTDNSSPTIVNCIIRKNMAYSSGGGICLLDNSSPIILRCIIRENTSRRGFGGGIHSSSSAPTIMHSTISENSASIGGGIYFYETSGATVSDCIIKGNFVHSFKMGDGGAGISLHGSRQAPLSVTIANCIIEENAGGGIFFLGDSSASRIENCIVRNNHGYGSAGISLSGASPEIKNCLISGNMGRGVAMMGGGGVYCYNSSPTLANCTIVGNYARWGGGIYLGGECSVTLIDCILSSNYAKLGAELCLDGPVSLTVEHSNIHNYRSGVQVYGEESVQLVGGNIDADPMFITGPKGDYYLSQGSAGQGATSPCVDSGSDSAANLGLDTLTTRTDKISDTDRVDMGYHYTVVRTPELSRINMVSPANASIRKSAPTFSWAPDAFTNNAYIVEVALSVDGPYHSSPAIRGETYWRMPEEWWDAVPSGGYVFWYIRGADLDVTPQKIIYNPEVWFFYKP